MKRLKIVSYSACRFEKSYFEKNAFEVLKCAIDMNKWKYSTLKKHRTNIFWTIGLFSLYLRRFKASFKPIKEKMIFWKFYSGFTP